MPAHKQIEGITKKNIETVARLERASIRNRTAGEFVADRVTLWVGSWTFLIVQSIILALWVVVNVVNSAIAWDPYPFVLLNLVLSFEAAFATPIILMSQNRQTRISERRHQLDLQVDLLAEQENTEQLRLLRLICERVGVEFASSKRGPLEEKIDPDVVMKQIVENEDPDTES